VLGHRYLGAGVDVAFVELLCDLHEADAGHLVASKDRSFKRCGASPARQEREVNVDHRKRVENVIADDVPERDDDPKVGTCVEHIVDVVADWQAQLDRCRLHRRRHQVLAPPPTGIRVRHDQRDVVACLDKCLEWSNRDLG